MDPGTEAAAGRPEGHARPLTGVRVIELAGIGPAPFASMMFAQMGAEVIRVQRPDPGPFAVYSGGLMAHGVTTIELDLRSDAGRDELLGMLPDADVLVEGNRPGVAERLGLGPQHCHARNPRLVYGRVTGWGQDGPVSHTAGHDLTYLAVSGSLHPLGRAGGPPTFPINLLGDFAGGSLYLVSGVLAALLQAQRTGTGCVIDAAIIDGAAHLATFVHNLRAMGLWDRPRGDNLLDGGAPWYDVYETSDGEWMAVAPLEPAFFAEFARLLPLDATEADRRDPGRWPALRAAISARIRERTRAEWTDLFIDTDACVAPVLSLGEAAAHPQLSARATLTEVGGIVGPAPAPRFVQYDPQ